MSYRRLFSFNFRANLHSVNDWNLVVVLVNSNVVVVCFIKIDIFSIYSMC